MKHFEFTIEAHDISSRARVGRLGTPHGMVETPCFMPCGTKGAVKTLTPDELKALGCEMLLSNTYHLLLRPGPKLIEEFGGLHQWMGWNGPILTDSGGYQVFSLQGLRKITDDGVTFQSHIDGSTHTLTPEGAIQIQNQLGADIIMAFDECAPPESDHAYAARAMERTHTWLLRCIQAHKRDDQALFPIIQGGIFPDLRRASTEFINNVPGLGVAIGGVAVGEGKEKMYEVLELVTPRLPKEKPHYLMGVGEPDDIVRGVACGIDMFDCVLPTRLARHGTYWSGLHERTSILLAANARSEEPLDTGCACYTCQRFSKSYLRHLFIEKEMLGYRLLTIHNLYFVLELLRTIRTSIRSGTFNEIYHQYTLNVV